MAELIAGEIGRALGLKVPEYGWRWTSRWAAYEEDTEIRDLLKASVELNLALDYLPGSVSFDPAARNAVEADLASSIVWFDAFVTNVDRTPRNPNLLWWHKVLYLIDHGAALYFHHNWQDIETAARSRFPAVRDHVLLPWASRIEEVDRRLRPQLNEALFASIVEQIPEDWLTPEPGVRGRSCSYRGRSCSYHGRSRSYRGRSRSYRGRSRSYRGRSRSYLFFTETLIL